MIAKHRTVRSLFCWRAGAGLVGSAAVVAMFGVAVAYADPTNALDTPAIAASNIDGDAIPNILNGMANLAKDSFTQALDYFQDTSQVTTNPADLLATVSTNLTDANKVLSGVPGAEGLEIQQEGWLKAQLAPLQAAESAISSHDGFLSNVVDQLFLDPIDENLVRASDALIHADQALAMATASDSGVEAANLDVGSADFQMGLALLNSFPILYVGDFVTLLSW
jgi:hypothetical protein